MIFLPVAWIDQSMPVGKWHGLGQSCEEEVLVWVFPNHESKTSDLEKPILALPIHRIDIPEKLKKWHQEVEKVASGG